MRGEVMEFEYKSQSPRQRSALSIAMSRPRTTKLQIEPPKHCKNLPMCSIEWYHAQQRVFSEVMRANPDERPV